MSVNLVLTPLGLMLVGLGLAAIFPDKFRTPTVTYFGFLALILELWDIGTAIIEAIAKIK